MTSGLRSKFGSLSPHIGTQVHHVHSFSYNKGYFYRWKKEKLRLKSTADLPIEIKRMHPFLPLEWKVVWSLYICRLINSKITTQWHQMTLYLCFMLILILVAVPPPLLFGGGGGTGNQKGIVWLHFCLVKLPMTETHENCCRWKRFY